MDRGGVGLGGVEGGVGRVGARVGKRVGWGRVGWG